MSHSNLFLNSGFPKAVLNNGIGRYVCQLQRLTIKFCKSHGSSRGVRDFIETELVNFARENPGIVVYVKPRRHKTPVLTAEYLSGDRKWFSLNNASKEEVIQWINLFKTQSGRIEMRLRKHWHTENPSIQGPWTPLTNRDPALNLATFPCKELSQPLNQPRTATEQLIEIFEKQKREIS